MNTGIKTVITIHDFTVQDDFTGASLVIDNLGEPGQAFTVIDGNDFGKAYVDTALLQLIHRAGIAENGNEEWPGDLAAVMK